MSISIMLIGRLFLLGKYDSLLRYFNFFNRVNLYPRKIVLGQNDSHIFLRALGLVLPNTCIFFHFKENLVSVNCFLFACLVFCVFFKARVAYSVCVCMHASLFMHLCFSVSACLSVSFSLCLLLSLPLSLMCRPALLNLGPYCLSTIGSKPSLGLLSNCPKRSRHFVPKRVKLPLKG